MSDSADIRKPNASPEPQRHPIVWTGRAKEPEKAGAGAKNAAAGPKAQQQQQPQETKQPQQRLKLNTAFLLNVVADAERGNQRRCAEDATAVSLSVLEKVRSLSGASCGAGILGRRMCRQMWHHWGDAIPVKPCTCSQACLQPCC